MSNRRRVLLLTKQRRNIESPCSFLMPGITCTSSHKTSFYSFTLYSKTPKQILDKKDTAGKIYSISEKYLHFLEIQSSNFFSPLLLFKHQLPPYTTVIPANARKKPQSQFFKAVPVQQRPSAMLH